MSASVRPTRFAVIVQPRAARTEIAGLHDGAVRIRVAAPAVGNAANRELLAFVAGRLRVSKRALRIAAGVTSRRKWLEVDGVSLEAVTAALAPASP